MVIHVSAGFEIGYCFDLRRRFVGNLVAFAVVSRDLLQLAGETVSAP